MPSGMPATPDRPADKTVDGVTWGDGDGRFGGAQSVSF
jgi:hypothetical protein